MSEDTAQTQLTPAGQEEWVRGLCEKNAYLLARCGELHDLLDRARRERDEARAGRSEMTIDELIEDRSRVYRERDEALAEVERLQAEAKAQHRGRLRSAVFHWERDEEAGSCLFGLELPDDKFADHPDKAKAEEFIDAGLRQIRDVFMRVWDERRRAV